jgi:ketosteroid isomerase-like protein
MYRLMLAFALFALPAALHAQAARPGDLAARIAQLEDRAALKALVDTFSILADRKDVQRQLLLFTEDATVESRTGGAPGSPLRGRKQIGDAFSGFLANFQTVYHINGQQAVDLHGDRATGTSYCLVVLIGNENGKAIKTTMGVTYDDEYVRRGGTWLIAKRVSHFTWRDREEMAAAAPR